MLAAGTAWKLLDLGEGGGIFLTLKGFCQEINGEIFCFLTFFSNIQCKFY